MQTGVRSRKSGNTTSKITAIRMGSAVLLMPSLLPTQMRPLNSSSSLSTSNTASECFMERLETCCEPPASETGLDASRTSAGQTPLTKWNPGPSITDGRERSFRSTPNHPAIPCDAPIGSGWTWINPTTSFQMGSFCAVLSETSLNKISPFKWSSYSKILNCKSL